LRSLPDYPAHTRVSLSIRKIAKYNFFKSRETCERANSAECRHNKAFGPGVSFQFAKTVWKRARKL
jgi:hypothetical protein